MNEEEYEGEPDVTWTDPARTLLRAAAERLVSAIWAHTDTLTGLEGRAAELVIVFDANAQLAEAASAYADAQMDLSGTGWPLGPIDIDDEEEPDEDDDEEENQGDMLAVSILSRDDYLVQNVNAVIEAGRSAYLKVWGDKATPEDAAVRVRGIGAALYEISHEAGSLEVLRHTPGIQPTSGATWIVPTVTPLVGGPDDDPFAPPEGGWQTLFGQRNSF